MRKNRIHQSIIGHVVGYTVYAIVQYGRWGGGRQNKGALPNDSNYRKICAELSKFYQVDGSQVEPQEQATTCELHIQFILLAVGTMQLHSSSGFTFVKHTHTHYAL